MAVPDVEEPTHSRIPQRAQFAIVIGTILLLATGVLAAIHLANSPAAVDSADPSFQFGEDLMINKIYNTLDGPANSACRLALDDVKAPVAHFSLVKAFAGCTYAEYQLDN